MPDKVQSKQANQLAMINEFAKKHPEKCKGKTPEQILSIMTAEASSVKGAKGSGALFQIDVSGDIGDGFSTKGKKKSSQSSKVSNEETKKALISEIRAKIKALESETQAEKSSKRGIGRFWNGVKGIIGKGTKGEEAKIAQYKTLLAEVEANPTIENIQRVYKTVVGKSADTSKVEASLNTAMDLEKGSIKLENGKEISKEDIKRHLTEQAEGLSATLDKTAKEQGWLSKGISWVNDNVAGLGTTKSGSKAQIDAYRELVQQLDNCKDPKEYAALYKQLTGEDLTAESLEGLTEGKSKVENTKAAESIMDYEETQASALDGVAGAVAGIASTVTIAALALTGPAGVVAGAAIGAAVYSGLKATDAATRANGKGVGGNLKDYAKEDLAKDLLMGGLTGALNGFTAGIGGKVTTKLMSKVGSSSKPFLTKMAIKAVGDATEGAIDGAISSGGEYAIGCITDKDKKFSFKDLGRSVGVGAAFGAGSGALASAIGSGVEEIKYQKELKATNKTSREGIARLGLKDENTLAEISDLEEGLAKGRRNFFDDNCEGGITANNAGRRDALTAHGFSNDKVGDMLDETSKFSGLAYNDYDGIDIDRINGNLNTKYNKLDSASNSENGFTAHAYKSKDGNSIVVAFRGTDDGLDIKSDKFMASGKLPEQYTDAMNFVNKIKAENPNASITVTGHSMGGALAQLAASTDESLFAVAYNPLGTMQVIKNNHDRLTNFGNTCSYVVKGDRISNALEHPGLVTFIDKPAIVDKSGNSYHPHAIQNLNKKTITAATSSAKDVVETTTKKAPKKAIKNQVARERGRGAARISVRNNSRAAIRNEVVSQKIKKEKEDS